MATVDLKNWDKKNIASVNNLSDSSSFTGLKKVHPIKVTWNNSSPSNGSGDVEFDSSVSVSSNSEIVVTESDETTTRSYEIESLDTTNNVAWLWVYGSWDSDGSDQIVIGAGSGDGTDYSTANSSMSNPWGQTGINAELIQELNESNGDAIDSSPTGKDGTINGADQGVSGNVATAYSFDGTDDNVQFGSKPSGWNLSAASISITFKPDDLSDSSEFIFDAQGSNEARIAITHNTPAFKLREINGSVGLIIRPDEDDGGAFVSVDTDNSVLNKGEYNRIICTWSDPGDPNTWNIYVNGDSKTFSVQSNTASNSDDIPLGNSFEIGSANQKSSDFTSGDIDSFEVYDNEKSSTYVQADYDASPKGGQTFFSWSGQKDISGSVNETVSGVKETSESGVILTS